MNFSRRILMAVFLLLSITITARAQEYKISNGAPISGNNSDVIDYNIPSKLTPGQNFTVMINMVNTGITTWSTSNNYSLRLYSTANDNYHTNGWNVSRVEIPHDVLPADRIIFTFNVSAPTTSGVYDMRWAMAKGNEFFGEYTNNVINVGGEYITPVSTSDYGMSEFVSIDVPRNMTAGEKYNVKVTMKNTGTTEWSLSPSTEYKLAPVIESSDITYPKWNTNSIYLSKAVQPGEVLDLEFDVTAPLEAGAYDLQWMMKKGDSYFGSKTDRVTVNVSEINSDKSYNSSFLKQDIPNTMQFNQDQKISVTFSNTGSSTWIQGSEQLVIIDAKGSVVTLNLWNVGYVQLPHNVEPASTVTFDFQVKPIEPGWQHFQCSMMRRDGTLFGSSSQGIEVLVSK